MDAKRAEIVADVPAGKRCSRCAGGEALLSLWRGREWFRARGAGSRRLHAACRDCHRLDSRERRALAAARRLREFATDVHRYRHGTFGQVSRFVAIAVRRFGGVTRLVEALHDHFLRARAQGRHDIAARLLMLVVELQMAVAACESTATRPAKRNRSKDTGPLADVPGEA